mgnify:CR=1 FL=1
MDHISNAYPKGDGKGSIAEEAGDHMDGQPVTLQGGDERADPARYARHEGGHGYSDGSQRSGDDSDGPLAISDIHNEIYQDDGPGEKDEGFVHIGEGDIAVSRSVTFPPSNYKTCQVDNKTDEDDPECNPAHRLFSCCHKQEVPHKGDDIDEQRPVKEVRIIHA